MFCTKCAAPILDPQRPCQQCGAELLSERHVASPAAQRPRRRWTVNLLPVLAVALVLLAVGARSFEHRREQERSYSEGRAALAAGDLLGAHDAFAAAGDHRDAKAHLAALDTQLAPFRDATDRASSAIDAGHYDDAIALLIPVVQALPTDERAFALLDEARAARYAAWQASAATAQQSGNWLLLQTTLTKMRAERPDDAAVVESLAEVTRNHAPLLYVRDGDLYVSEPDGTSERAIVSGYHATWPMWSPDRTEIAFATRSPDRRSIAGDLYVVNADGSDVRLLTDQFLPFAWPVWSPDGARIAFSNPSAFEPADGSGHIDVAVIELATGAITNITQGRFDFATSATWAPDGSRLAFVDRVRVTMGNGFDFKNGDVHQFEFATGKLTNVTGDTLLNERQVSWSPVDNRLLVYTDPGDWSSDDEGQIVIWDLATSAMTIVPTDVRSPEPAVWSPDGARIAWVEGTDVVKFWSAAGVEWVRVTTDIGPALTWAPDGHAIFAPTSSLSGPSYEIAVDATFGMRSTLKLAFDVNNGSTGLPIWAPRTAPAAPPDGGGTALDAG